jgi:hypothetical protein
MLEDRDVQALLDQLWLQLGCEVALPEPVESFMAPKGPLPMEYVDKRRHRRFHFRQKAILTRNGRHSAVYTKNIARRGLGFLTSQQLFPLEEFSLALPTGDRVRLKLRRCRRVQENCYECGAEIVEVSHELDRQLLGLIATLATEMSDATTRVPDKTPPHVTSAPAPFPPID